MELYFCNQKFGDSAVSFSLNLMYISGSSGKISPIFVVNKSWIRSYLTMITAKSLNSRKRLIQISKFSGSIMAVTTSSHSNINIKITFYS